MTIRFNTLSVDFDERFQLEQINWQIDPQQHWVITGTNGAGKSALAAVLAGAGEIISGSVEGIPAKVGLVSFEAQAELIAAELKKTMPILWMLLPRYIRTGYYRTGVRKPATD